MINVSIIFPIYNVKNYLKKSVNSIRKQTLKNIEIILVDDGSKDGSDKLVDKFAKKDKRIINLHQKNSGAAAARNFGMSKAKGKYLYFMDPDDWVQKDYLKKMYLKSQKTQAQLLISGFTNVYATKNKTFTTKTLPKEIFYSNPTSFRKNAYKYFNNSLLAVPWNKLYLNTYIQKKNLKFPNTGWDDLHFNLEVIRNIQSVDIVRDASYHFIRERPGSETTKVFNHSLFDKRKSQFNHILEIYKDWNIKDSKSIQTIYFYYESRLVEAIQETSGDHSRSYKNKILTINSILNDPLTLQAIKKGKGNSALIKLCLMPMKMRSAFLSFFVGKSISIVKLRFQKIFYILKIRIMTSKK